jgi:hypothetical protein
MKAQYCELGRYSILTKKIKNQRIKLQGKYRITKEN